MIEIRWMEDPDAGGLWLPMVICDICQFPIDNRKEISTGIAIWTAAGPCCPNDVKPIDRRAIKFGRPALHVHLGRCETSAKDRIGDAVRWGPLKSHLDYLCYNAGIRVQKGLETAIYGRADEISRLEEI